VAALGRLSALERQIGQLIAQPQEIEHGSALAIQEQCTNSAVDSTMANRLESLTTDVAALRHALIGPDDSDGVGRLASVERQMNLLLERISSVLEEVEPAERESARTAYQG